MNLRGKRKMAGILAGLLLAGMVVLPSCSAGGDGSEASWSYKDSVPEQDRKTAESEVRDYFTENEAYELKELSVAEDGNVLYKGHEKGEVLVFQAIVQEEGASEEASHYMVAEKNEEGDWTLTHKGF